MSILNPDYLLEQAEALIEAPVAGPPRQVNLRRGVSTAYYAVFHFILTVAADEFIGVTKRHNAHYSLVYRSVDHRTLRELCEEAIKTSPKEKYIKYIPANGLGKNVQAFAAATLELQKKRHSADYDPSYRVKTSDVKLTIETARSAIRRFNLASPKRKKAFVTLLLFPPR